MCFCEIEVQIEIEKNSQGQKTPVFNWNIRKD
jgi:hypothetical protein